MAKTFANAKSAKAAPKAQPAATESAAPAAKAEYTPKPNEFGAFKNITSKKSGNTFQAIEVAQDMTLQKGQLIVFQSLGDELTWLTENDHITAEEAEQRNEKLSPWLLGKFKVMAPKES